MSISTVEVRTGCPAPRHDTLSAYKKDRCRCELARAARRAQRTRYNAGHPRGKEPYRVEQRSSIVTAGVPDFHAHPDRGCANLKNPEVMFPKSAKEIHAALKVCRHCPFKVECAAWALETCQPYGVWGEITERERRKQIIARLAAGLVGGVR